MIEYIMFNGNKYVSERLLTDQERKQAFLVKGTADGLRFCITGMTRFYMRLGGKTPIPGSSLAEYGFYNRT